MYKVVGASTTTLNIEVRIGEVKLLRAFGKQKITANKRCGAISGTTANQVETFDCKPAIQGRYVSLQTTHTQNLQIAEVNLFTRGICRKTRSRRRSLRQCSKGKCVNLTQIPNT